MTLELMNNLDKTRVQLVINDPNFNRLYLSGTIQLPANLPDGEYTYWVINDNTILATGLAQLGDYEQPDKVVYNTPNNNDFIQYQN